MEGPIQLKSTSPGAKFSYVSWLPGSNLDYANWKMVIPFRDDHASNTSHGAGATYEQGSKDAMKGFNYDPPSLLKICDLLCVAIGGLM